MDEPDFLLLLKKGFLWHLRGHSLGQTVEVLRLLLSQILLDLRSESSFGESLAHTILGLPISALNVQSSHGFDRTPRWLGFLASADRRKEHLFLELIVPIWPLIAMRFSIV